MTCKSIISTFHSFLNAADFFPKTPSPKPARIHSPDPFLRAGKFSRGFAKSFSPENSFGKTESALKPHALPEYLEGRTPKEKHPFLFQEKFHPRQIRNARSVFSFGVAGVLASAWGFLRAYASVSLHHARGACDIICFGSRCEFGTIETPIRNSTIFSVDTNGRRKAPTRDFLAGLQENSEFLARKRAVFFRRGGGASQRFLWHRPF